MKDVNYGQWADYIEKLFRRNKVKPSLVLDLGCGTGSFCTEMARRGYEMIGIDISPEMLSCAGAKAIDGNLDILYLNQDMTSFELYGTVDAIVCLMDSMNYITNKNQIKRIFRLVKNYLNPGGLFIFDLNSRYKLENILGNNVYYNIDDDVAYIWQNSFDKAKDGCRFDLAFFIEKDGLYERFDEEHFERAYDEAEIRRLLLSAGLDILAVYHGFSLKAPQNDTERLFFVCRKF